MAVSPLDTKSRVHILAAMLCAVAIIFLLRGMTTSPMRRPPPIQTSLLHKCKLPRPEVDTAVESSGSQLSLAGPPLNSRVQGMHDIVPFYIYTGPVFMPDYCYSDDENEVPAAGYPCITRTFIAQALKHPWRVMDPEQAKIFVVPYDVGASILNRCNTGHFQNLMKVLTALQESPWYKRKGGIDHLWTIPDYRLPMSLDGHTGLFPNKDDNDVIKSMTIGRYLQYYNTFEDRNNIGYQHRGSAWPYELEHWRCTVKTPVMTPKSLWLPDLPIANDDGSPDHTMFEYWQQRQIFFFFRGRGHCNTGTSTQARAQAIELGRKDLPWPGKVIMTDAHAETPAKYHEEILDSKYCLVFGCDDPQTSRFVDSLAAGCIPVIINDDWRLAISLSPRRINYDAFTVTIPERLWLADAPAALHLVYHHPPAVHRQRFEALLEARKDILWRHPASNVATRLLQDANDCMAE
eukprot:m.221258 g.221258  ORF g.221258 m.221258 type:complete len:462 (-) comp19184_c0_seq1:379-1764(-)